MSDASWIGFVLVLVATGMAMAALGVLAGGLVLVFKRGELVTAVTMLAMGFLGGAYFPISVLPGWLQPLGDVVPTRFAFSGLRAALFRGEGWEGATLVLLVFGCVTLPLGVWLFSKALGLAKRNGSLSQY